MFTVDGMHWTFPCDIERVAEITASELSGMLLNKNYFNDVIGTYLAYTITIVVPIGAESEYAKLYDILTEPVDAHAFILPYNQGSINITGRVQNVSDVYRRMADGSIHWKGIKFSVISNAPSKTYTLGQVLTRGLSPMPDIEGAPLNAVYQYNGQNWVPADFQNGDNKSY